MIQLKAVQGVVNFTSGTNIDVKDRRLILSPTNAYFVEAVVFLYKVENANTSVANVLIGPFKFSVWLTIIFILFVATLIILWSKKLTRKWRHFIIGGRMNREPILNAWAAVTGHSTANPRIVNGRSCGNFSRTLTIHWLLLWFFVRSMYEGGIFSIFQRETASPYDTFEKVLASDCKIFVPKAFYTNLKEMIPNNR